MTREDTLMLKKIQIAVWAALICVGMAQAEDTLIYFQIVDSPTVVAFDGSEHAWNEWVSAEGYSIDSARVVVTGSNLAEETPLILGYISGNTVVSSGTDEIALDETRPPQTMYAFVTDYASAEYSFAIELGSYGSGEWTTLATSASLTYQQLQTGDGVNGSYITTYDATLPVPQGIWAPTSYNVPEPSSGLLILIGASLLALRRRRS